MAEHAVNECRSCSATVHAALDSAALYLVPLQVKVQPHSEWTATMKARRDTPG